MSYHDDGDVDFPNCERPACAYERFDLSRQAVVWAGDDVMPLRENSKFSCNLILPAAWRWAKKSVALF